MDYGAIDLHKRDSQIRIVTEGGEVLDRRIATTRDRLTAVFEGRRPMRILLEASKVRHVCDGGPDRRRMYFATVAWLTSISSFRSSLWIRGAPTAGWPPISSG